jgi:hypothetical protein
MMAQYAKLKAASAHVGPNNPPCVILSGESVAGNDGTDFLRESLQKRGYSFKEVVGVWHGRPETSFVVVLPDNYDKIEEGVEYLQALAFWLYQESILYLSRDRVATIIDCETGERLVIGNFRRVKEEVALEQDCYTYDPIYKEFYAVV